MIKEKILKLRKKIDEFVASGGNIYEPKEQLPYYEELHWVARYIRKKTGEEVTHDEIYKLCGYKHDKKYNNFVEFVKELSKFSDENGCVDKIRDENFQKKGGVYSKLKVRARMLDANPFDYLVLMTGFRFKDAYIEADYTEILKMELLQEYPKRDITGIRRNRPDLYEKIRAVARANPDLTMPEVVEFLGFYNSRMVGQITRTFNKEELLQEILTCFPDGNVNGITKKRQLYRKVVWAARVEGVAPGEWLIKNGLTYTNTLKSRRLVKLKVDGEERAKMLLKLKETALDGVNVAGLDAIDLYHKNLEATKRVIKLLNTYDPQIVNFGTKQDEK